MEPNTNIQNQRIAQEQDDPISRLLSPCYQCVAANFQIFNIFVFEFGSMVLFSYCVIAFGGIITFPGLWIVWGGMAISLAVSATFGFGHINPAVTFACMVKKEGRTPLFQAILLLLSQFLGAFAGTYIAWGANKQLIAPFPNIHSVDHVLETFWVEVIASFLFVLCILILVSSDTQMTGNNLEVWATIPLCLIAVCLNFNLGLGTNPAQALAFQVAYYSFHPGSQQQLSCIWSVIVGASLGGFLAGLFFQFGYRKYCRVYKMELLEMKEPLEPINLRETIRNTFLGEQPIQQNSIPRRTTQIQMQ